MRKFGILAVAVALSAVTVPSIISQAQAAPTKHPKHHPHMIQAAQHERAPAKKDPNCDNGYQKGNMNWQEHYHCF
jgi:hypothetical protein